LKEMALIKKFLTTF